MMSGEDEVYSASRRIRESAPVQPEHDLRPEHDRQPGHDRQPEPQGEVARPDPESRRREITVIEQDRIVAQLQDQVIQRVFRAGLTLQAAAKTSADPQVRRLIDAATDELDHVIREVRGVVFSHDQRVGGPGLREKIIDLSSRLVTAADISFAGPANGTLDAATSARLLDNLRQALALIGEYATPTRIDITARDAAHDIVIEAAPLGSEAGEPDRRFASLRARATQAGIPVQIEYVPGGARFTWHARIPPGAQGR
jgi:signal transduction histidine kinase